MEALVGWSMLAATIILATIAWLLVPQRGQLDAVHRLRIDLTQIESANRANITLDEPDNHGPWQLSIRILTTRSESPPSGNVSVWSPYAIEAVEECQVHEDNRADRDARCSYTDSSVTMRLDWSQSECAFHTGTDEDRPCYEAVGRIAITTVAERNLVVSKDGVTATGFFPELLVFGVGRQYGRTADIEAPFSEAVLHLPIEPTYQIVSGPVPGFTAIPDGTYTTWWLHLDGLGGAVQPILAVDRVQERWDSHRVFMAGVAAGLAGGSTLACFEAFLRLWRERREQ